MTSPAVTVEYDERSFIINGTRELLIGGVVHYPRTTPGMWPRIFSNMRADGLNAVQTYVFWNLHEHQRGVFDFSGRLDLMRYLREAQDAGLYVILRIGPYICAETNYGGFPPWLRDVPGIRMRTDNDAFKREMEQWMRTLCAYLEPMYASNGGPVILLQIENEYDYCREIGYGDAGERYLAWCAQLAHDLDTGVPWCMCGGHSPGVLSTVNSFCPHWDMTKFHERHPGQPCFCTEFYQTWYATFGCAPRVNRATERAYALARFFAAGGAGLSWFVWHGGADLGRQGMCLETQRYAISVLQEDGFPNANSRHYARLHHVLADRAQTLLAGPPEHTSCGDGLEVFSYGADADTVTFLCNDTDTAAPVAQGSGSVMVEAKSVVITDWQGQPLMDTSRMVDDVSLPPAADPAVPVAHVRRWSEPMPWAWPEGVAQAIVAEQPTEGLLLTHDTTDYCWYWREVQSDGDSTARLEIRGVADLAYVFVDDRLVARTEGPILEERGPLSGPGYVQTFDIPLSKGSQTLAILCGAMGLAKIDKMVGGVNMIEEKKGIWGPVLLDGRELTGDWHACPGLLGEHTQAYGAPGVHAPWEPVSAHPAGPLTWWKCDVELPRTGPGFYLDLGCMDKGIAWVNGHCIGRYWLIEGTLPVDELVSGVVQGLPPCGPTQRYYHLPEDWLRARNELVLIEEVSGDASSITVVDAATASQERALIEQLNPQNR